MTEKEWGVVISMYLGAIAVFTFITKLLGVNKNNVCSKKDFDKHLETYSHHVGAVTKEDYDQHVADFKHHKDSVQYKTNCKEIQRRICADVKNNREMLEAKLESVQEVIVAKIEAVNGK